MDFVRSTLFRENAPMFGVGAILFVAFAAMAAIGPVRTDPAAQIVEGDVASPPPVETLPADGEEDDPLESELAPDDAVARNAAVEIVEGGPGTAPSFIFAGSAADRVRARDCLALAAMAEAGYGDADQRAVMQVILNRTRHPGFANTVCGVVYQGSHRRTGCQFTFTCDGSLSRRYPDSEWRAARQRADEALGGRVEAAVGLATHYHADYVYPWWSPQLDKIAAVGPHMFYRWRGFWGTPQALNARYRGGEPDPMGLRETAMEIERPETILKTFAEDGAAQRTITSGGKDGPRLIEGSKPPSPAASAPATSPDPRVHFVLVARGEAPAALVERARALCPGGGFCQVYGWSDPSAIPSQLPLSDEARRTLGFSFLPARSGNGEAIYFDCRTFPDPAPGACLPRARP